mgnify:CR=1 FL=1
MHRLRKIAMNALSVATSSTGLLLHDKNHTSLPNVFFWYSIWSRTESFGGIGNTRLELSVLGACTTTEVFPVPMAIRRTPRVYGLPYATRSTISPLQAANFTDPKPKLEL